MVKQWFAMLDAHPRGRDAVVAAMWLLVGLACLQFGAYPLWSDIALYRSTGALFLLTLIAIVAVSTMRSRLPFLALGLAVPIATIDLAFGGSLGVIIVCTDLVYAAMKYGSDAGVRRLLWGLGVLAALCAVVLIVVPFTADAIPVAVVQGWIILAVSGAWGYNVRSERKRTQRLLAEQHSREDREFQQRIAHDLHDLIANQVAVAGLHIEASKLMAATLPGDTEALSRSLDQAKQGTEQAHQRLREFITVLTAVEEGQGEEHLDAAEALAALADLVPAGRALVWQGDGAAATLEALSARPAAHQRVLLRVLSELVMNAVKHGEGDIEVEAQRGSALTLTVTNTVGNAVTTASSGLGLAGARLLLSRVAGTLEVSGDRTPAPGEQYTARLTVLSVPEGEPRDITDSRTHRR